MKLGSNPNVYQQVDKQTYYDTATEWNTTQQYKGINY